MIQLDPLAGATRTPPDSTQNTRQGSTTVIILERDGSLRHYPPSRPGDRPRQAQVELNQDQTQQSLIAKILDFTFDVLRVDSLEVRVHEHPKG
jgi:hypothetical protein